MWPAFVASRQYLLPRHTGCIPLEPFLKPQKRLAGLLWLKKPADFEPAVRETALGEALEYLAGLHIRRQRRTQPLPTGLLVVAFGTKAQCFEWKFEGGDQERLSEREMENEEIPIVTSMGDGDIFDVYIDDQREGFEKIFMRFRDEVDAMWAASQR
jgi:hypothetical protein